MRWLGATVLVGLLLGWEAPAGALTVAIVSARAAPALTKETVVRLSLELASVGFAIELAELPPVPPDGPTPWMESVAARRRLDAVVAILGDLAPIAVEVWAIDRVTGRSVSRRLPVDVDANAERAPETLAIRAMELLRSSLLEIDLTAGTPRGKSDAQPPATPGPWVGTDQSIGRPERFAIEVGAAAVAGPGGVGLAVLPIVHLDWVLWPSLITQAALAGLGTRASVDKAAGSAQVGQEYLVLGIAYRFRANRQLRPFVALSGGALHTSVEGWADPPNQGRRANQWSFVVDAGLGAALRLRDRFFLTAAADAQMAEPYVAVRFLESVVATRSRPNVVLALTVGAWL